MRLYVMAEYDKLYTKDKYGRNSDILYTLQFFAI
jgi:hypothetical protein